MNTPYQLRDESGSSRRFYASLERFSKEVVEKAKGYSVDLSLYETHQRNPPTRGEVVFEFLLLGSLIRLHGRRARESWGVVLFVSALLFFVRRKCKLLKPVADKLRGVISTLFLWKKEHGHQAERRWDIYDVETLLGWLRATGEYHEEGKRLQTWTSILKMVPESRSNEVIDHAIAFSLWFEKMAALQLGEWTEGVAPFLEKNLRGYRWREDILLCAKAELEYHLNMFGAEMMNHALRYAFDQCHRTVLLVPGCMAEQKKACKAKVRDGVLQCTGCSKTCRVFSLRTQGHIEGYETYLIPHSSGFSDQLRRWQGEENTRIVAAACVLNLVMGGYEMNALGIPSQCVFLDFAGCKKHWDPKGSPTSLDFGQLKRVLGGPMEELTSIPAAKLEARRRACRKVELNFSKDEERAAA